MAYLWKKYEFESEEQADSKISALSDNHNVVRLGYLSDKYSVDVLWEGLEESPFGWKSYEITLKDTGVHSFWGHNFNDIE